MARAGKKNMCNSRRLPYVSTQSYRPHHPYQLLLFASLFSQVSSSPLPIPHISQHNTPASTSLYDKRRTFNVWVIAASCAAVSMITSFIAFYWFCRMEKRFRHRLIMLLIYGDLMRATWLFIFAIVSIRHGTVYTHSSFCQASGFLVQYGSETSDFSVLVIAIHSAAQVFRSSSLVHSDGLYPFRHYVYVGAILVPVMMAGLAFVNPHWGYMSQGAFCSLPLRPFWYRLALAWIPRYLIAIIILGLAVAIYIYVGFEFRDFSRVDESTKPSTTTTTPMLSAGDMGEGTAVGLEPPEIFEQEMQMCPGRRASSVVHDVAASRRRASAVTFLVDDRMTYFDCLESSGRSQSLPATPHDPNTNSDLCRSSTTQTRSITPKLDSRPTAQDPGPSPNNSRTTSPMSCPPASYAQQQLVQERNRIHHQLRLMFIYPLVYILMWIIPFVSHCMTYQDKWATHPLYWLSLSSTICITLMGAIDCLIFSLRERPWRYIPNSNGTFLGSFICWRSLNNYNHNRDSPAFSSRPRHARQGTLTDVNPIAHRNRSVGGNPESGSAARMSSVPRTRQSARMFGSGGYSKTAAGLAKMRLECEKEDRRLAVLNRGGKVEVVHSLGEEIDGFDTRESV